MYISIERWWLNNVCILPSIYEFKVVTELVPLKCELISHGTFLHYHSCYCWLSVCASSSKSRVYSLICLPLAVLLSVVLNFHNTPANNVLHGIQHSFNCTTFPIPKSHEFHRTRKILTCISFFFSILFCFLYVELAAIKWNH